VSASLICLIAFPDTIPAEAAQAPSLKIEIVKGQGVKHNLRHPEPSNVIVRVLDPEGRRLLAAERAVVIFKLPGEPFQKNADEQGLATSRDFEPTGGPGKFTIEVIANHEVLSGKEPIQQANVDFQVVIEKGPVRLPGRTASGVVVRVEEDSRPVAGALVLFQLPDSGPSGVFEGAGHQARAITNADGRAASPELNLNYQGGEIPIEVRATTKDGLWDTAAVALNMPPMVLRFGRVVGEKCEYNIRKPEACRVAVQVVDGEDQPVRAQVVFRLPDKGPGGVFQDGRREAGITADGEGWAVMPGFVPNKIAGDFQVGVTARVDDVAKVSMAVPQANTFRPEALTVAILTPQEGTKYNVRQPIETKVLVVVKDEKNLPVDGAEVAFTVISKGRAGGAFADSTPRTTSSNGQAVSSSFKPNQQKGRFQIEATAKMGGTSDSAKVELENVGPFPYWVVLVAAAAGGTGAAAAMRGKKGGSTGGTGSTTTAGQPPTRVTIGPITVGAPP
jgi:hypothetical protein